MLRSEEIQKQMRNKDLTSFSPERVPKPFLRLLDSSKVDPSLPLLHQDQVGNSSRSPERNQEQHLKKC